MSNLAYTDDYKERFELIDGKIIMMSPRPRIAHSIALGNIFREFSIYLKGKKCEAFADGVDVYLDVSLKRFDIVYPACGTPNSAAKLNIEELEKASNFKKWIDVCKNI